MIKDFEDHRENSFEVVSQRPFLWLLIRLASMSSQHQGTVTDTAGDAQGVRSFIAAHPLGLRFTPAHQQKTVTASPPRSSSFV
jgi:hypothetical protein